jgi:hypothetical protein
MVPNKCQKLHNLTKLTFGPGKGQELWKRAKAGKIRAMYASVPTPPKIEASEH